MTSLIDDQPAVVGREIARRPPRAHELVAWRSLRSFQVWSAVVLALALRVLSHLDKVVHRSGIVPTGDGDVYYHIRRIQLATKLWPRVPDFDAWLSYPDGAFSAWPPAFDFFPATFAHFSRLDPTLVAVFWPPLLGALTVLPLFAIAGRVYGRDVAAATGLLFAILPANVVISCIGRVDHHVAEVLLQIWVYAFLLRDLCALEAGRQLRWRTSVGFGALMGSCVLTWMGSLLFLIVPAAIVALWSLPPRRSEQASRGVRHLASAYAVAALVALPYGALNVLRGRPAMGFYFVSLLQPALCLVLAAAVVGLGWVVAAFVDRGYRAAAARLCVLCAVAITPLLLPGLRHGLFGGLSFVTRKGDAFAQSISESVPLLSTDLTRTFALQHVGYGHYLLPVLIVWLASQALHKEQRRADILVLLVWSTHVTVLAAMQARFLYYAAPVICLLPGAFAHGLRRFGKPAALTGAALATLALWPGLTYWKPFFTDGSMARVPIGHISPDRIVFLGELRRLTPPAGDTSDPNTRPAYCVFARWSLGHELVVLAQRAAVANNFGPYVEGGSYEDAQRMYSEIERDDAAVALLARRGCRYLVTDSMSTWPVAGTSGQRFARRLHAADGGDSGEGQGSGRFALIAESPARDLEGHAEHKLFAVVPGATLELTGLTEREVRLVTRVRVGDRSFEYARAVEAAGPGATARARLAYPGIYRVLSGDAELGRVRVEASVVDQGKTLVLGRR